MASARSLANYTIYLAARMHTTNIRPFKSTNKPTRKHFVLMHFTSMRACIASFRQEYAHCIPINTLCDSTDLKQWAVQRFNSSAQLTDCVFGWAWQNGLKNIIVCQETARDFQSSTCRLLSLVVFRSAELLRLPYGNNDLIQYRQIYSTHEKFHFRNWSNDIPILFARKLRYCACATHAIRFIESISFHQYRGGIRLQWLRACSASCVTSPTQNINIAASSCALKVEPCEHCMQYPQRLIQVLAFMPIGTYSSVWTINPYNFDEIPASQQ